MLLRRNQIESDDITDLNVGGSILEEPKIINDVIDDRRTEISVNDTRVKTEEIGTIFALTSFPLEDLIHFPAKPFKKFRSYSITKQRWAGYITAVKGDKFTSILRDYKGKLPDIEVEFSKDDVPESDKDLIRENMFFDWVMEKEKDESGTVRNTDYLLFMRLPAWRKRELEQESDIVNEFDNWLQQAHEK